MLVQYLLNMLDRKCDDDWTSAQAFRAAIRFLNDNKGNTPFFLWIDSFDPHEPWDAPQWYVDRYDPGYQGEVVAYPKPGPCDYLTPAELEDPYWLPSTCAYRLLAEGKDLPDWHPLISGDPDTVIRSGNTILGRCVCEDDADELDQHIITWMR